MTADKRRDREIKLVDEHGGDRVDLGHRVPEASAAPKERPEELREGHVVAKADNPPPSKPPRASKDTGQNDRPPRDNDRAGRD